MAFALLSEGAFIAPVLSLARGGAAEAPEGAPSWVGELRRFPGLFEDFEAAVEP